MLKPSVNDPQGLSIRNALRTLGFGGVEDVRAGKLIQVRLEAAIGQAAEAAVERMCAQLLANPVIETFAFSARRSASARSLSASSTSGGTDCAPSRMPPVGGALAVVVRAARDQHAELLRDARGSAGCPSRRGSTARLRSRPGRVGDQWRERRRADSSGSARLSLAGWASEATPPAPWISVDGLARPYTRAARRPPGAAGACRSRRARRAARRARACPAPAPRRRRSDGDSDPGRARSSVPPTLRISSRTTSTWLRHQASAPDPAPRCSAALVGSTK